MIRMSTAEKHAMRTRLQDAMRISTRPARPVKSQYVWYSWRMAGSFAMLVLIVLGTGTTYAAQGALPGSPLYAVKVGVTEPIKGALAFSNEAKVKFHTEVAETRLEEAEVLASQGRLSSEVSATLAANITEHVERVQTIAKKIEEVDPVAALEVTLQFDSSLAAHGEVLAHLGSESEDQATRENSVVVAYSASKQNMGGSGDASATMAMRAIVPVVDIEVATFSATMVSDTSTGTEASSTVVGVTAKSAANNAASSSSVEEKVVNQLERRVEGRLQAVRSQFNALNKSLTATSSAAVEARINFIEKQIEAGKEAKENEDFVLAKAEYNSALGSVIELSTFLAASKRFNKGILESLLGKYHIDIVGEVKGVEDIEMGEGKIEPEKNEHVEAQKGIKIDIGL